MITIPAPQKTGALTEHFNVAFGPGVLLDHPAFASSIGLTIAYIAEAERQLSAILKTLIGGDTRVIAALLASFRGHKQLLGAVETALRTADRTWDLDTFVAIRRPTEDTWEIRDCFGHGIWAKSNGHPGTALRISARHVGGIEEKAKWLIAEGRFTEAFEVYANVGAEIWTPADFSAAATAARGVVNSLTAFSACIGQSPEEADPLHKALRSQGLLSDPPWKLQSPTQPPENDGTR